jgi:DNA-binding NarL/FixJ family response regulator
MDLEMQVQDMGHAVVGMAMDVASCRSAATERPPDVALMDLRLKGGDSGEDAAGWLRETLDVPCIFVSGNLDDDTRKRLTALAPLGFVGKPVLPSRLTEALERAGEHLRS